MEAGLSAFFTLRLYIAFLKFTLEAGIIYFSTYCLSRRFSEASIRFMLCKSTSSSNLGLCFNSRLFANGSALSASA